MDEHPPRDPSPPPAPASGAGGPDRRRPAMPPRPIEPVRPAREGAPGRPPARGERTPRPGPLPLPARQGVESAPRDPLRPVELPSRAIEHGGEAWLVREGGRSSAGVGRDTRAPLLHLLFALAGDPERTVRETLAPGHAIADLTDDELLALLARARPFEERNDRPEVFPDTRKQGGKGM